MDVQNYIDSYSPDHGTSMAAALVALNELERQVDAGFEAFSACFEVFSKSKTLAEIARGMIQKVVDSNAGAPARRTTPIDPSQDQHPPTNDKNPSSDDENPSTNDKNPSTSDKNPSTSDKNPSTSDKNPSTNEKNPAINDDASIDRSKDKHPATNENASIDLSRDPRPGARARLAAQNASNAQPRAHVESVDGRAPPHTRQASTDDNAPRRRRHSSADPAPNVNDSSPPSSTFYSSRANGPSDTIAGMAPDHDASRLRLLERATLPKGNINGIAYNCEARCGYPDSATESLIQCESNFHGKQATLQQPDGTRGERGWYHGPCGNVAPDNEPNGWICPACVQRGTTSTNNDDDENGADEDDDNSGHGDDSEDDFHPGQHTPGESSDDEAGGDEVGEDDEYYSHQPYHSQESNAKNGGKRRRYILSSDSEDGEDDQTGDEDEDDILPSIEDDYEQHEEGADERDENDGQEAQNSVPWKTRAGDPWTEVEKLKTIKHMEDICKEGKIKGEERFKETSRRLIAEGYERHWVSVKNIWNRGLRQRSGIDERRNKTAPLTTSKQDAKTKRENKEKKERQRRSDQSDSVSSRHISPKREHESSSSSSEEEVVPPKRRRAAPHAADYFPGLE